LADERARKRGELLAATEEELAKIAAATGRQRRPLRGKDKIALRVGTVRNHYKMAKHFDLQITDDSFTFTRKNDQITAELAVRPIRHRLADRVRAHMFLRMLSYYISWHMKQALAPILFCDNDKPAAAAKRADPVAAAQRSDEALTKAARKRPPEDTPVHSFTSLLADLATLCANQIQPADDMPAFTMPTSPTPLQRRALDRPRLSP